VLELVQGMSGVFGLVHDALAAGRVGLALFVLALIVGSLAYAKYIGACRAKAVLANKKEQIAAQIENAQSNKADEVSQKKAENEVEAILKGDS
jgi:hypothetical protein